jgi:DNA-binding transcriptional regulator YdaS (Cro superfamily)
VTPTEMFERVGRALTVGRDWRSSLATALGIRPDSVRHMSNGRAPLRPGHFQDLLAAIVVQREELARVEQELREWLAEQPPEK